MRVLVMESDRHVADSAIWSLRRAGHEIVRCHEEDLGAFPCNALCDGGSCPVEDDRGVDVALTVRGHAYGRPTAYEDGVSCALRRGVPLVVAGVTAMNPFDKWTTVDASDAGVVEACEEASTRPIERLAQPARTEIRRRLSARSAPADGADVDVRRHGRRLAATITLAADAPEIDGELAVSVAGVLRAKEPSASYIDVAVQRSGS